MADGKPKRSLFKRPAWAATTTPVAASTSPDPASTTEAPTDIFSHSHNFSDLVQDRQRQRRKKTEKHDRRPSQTSKVRDEDPPSGKRRRISHEDATELPTQAKGKQAERRTSVQASAGSENFAALPTPRKTRSRQETVIELLDDSDHDEPVNYNNASHDTPHSNPASNFQSLEPTPAAEEADPDAVYYSDPEMQEYARQAREKRRREEREKSASGAHDPTVKLLITSPLPATVPLIVSRKLSQDLQAVREAWISKQTFDPLTADGIFFTFKLRKLYDSTTVRSLGIKVDSYGRIMGNGPFASDNEHAEKIHIEAVTDEAWQELKDKKNAPKPIKCLGNAAGADNRRHGADGTPALDGETVVEEPLIKITLKARGHSDIKIKVRPSTTFFKMINAARRSFKLDPDRQIHLEFDGERLEPPEGLVKDTDISDMDCIDVHIK